MKGSVTLQCYLYRHTNPRTQIVSLVSNHVRISGHVVLMINQSWYHKQLSVDEWGTRNNREVIWGGSWMIRVGNLQDYGLSNIGVCQCLGISQKHKWWWASTNTSFFFLLNITHFLFSLFFSTSSKLFQSQFECVKINWHKI